MGAVRLSHAAHACRTAPSPAPVLGVISQLCNITKFYTVVKSPQKQALTPVYIVKSSVTLNKRAIQKLIEMRLNPQITHMGILRGPQSQSKM